MKVIWPEFMYFLYFLFYICFAIYLEKYLYAKKLQKHFSYRNMYISGEHTFINRSWITVVHVYVNVFL